MAAICANFTNIPAEALQHTPHALGWGHTSLLRSQCIDQRMANYLAGSALVAD